MTDRLDVLHTLRIKGRVSPDAELGRAELVEELVEAGLVNVTPRGRTLTRAGFAEHMKLLAAQRASIDIEGVASGYERFLRVNAPVKNVCSQWQSSDTATDDDLFGALGKLEDSLDRTRSGLEATSKIVGRFGRYSTGLFSALDRIAAGERAYIADPGVDSFHTLWFECHEDYLLTLGIDREEEEKQGEG